MDQPGVHLRARFDLHHTTVKTNGEFQARGPLPKRKKPARFPECAAFVLAGGQSSRMGRDKALLEFAGTPLILHTAHVLELLVGAVTVIGPPEPYAPLGLRAIQDDPCDTTGSAAPQGPLVGIATALRSTTTSWNLILACDLPFLTAEWLNWLLTRALKSGESGAQIVIPETPHGLEPLAAVYRRECAAHVSAAVNRGVRKVTDAFTDLALDRLQQSEWRAFDPESCVLRNMNTAEDYEFAKMRRQSQAGQKSDIRRVRRAHLQRRGAVH